MRKDFSISHVMADQDWAQWINRQLQDAGYTTMLQIRGPGPDNHVSLTNRGARAPAERTVAVLSPDYLESVFDAPDRPNLFPGEQIGQIVPVRVRACDPGRLLGEIGFIDLVDLDEPVARAELLNGIQRYRSKSSPEPGFPGTSNPSDKPQPHFPGPDNGIEPSNPIVSPSQASILRSFWRGLPRAGKVVVAVVPPLFTILAALIERDVVPLPFGPEPDSSVVISNAVLDQVDSTEQGEVLVIAYDITLTNMTGDSVVVRALPIDAVSREPVRTLWEPSTQGVEATTANDSGRGKIPVPFPLDAGCIVVRVDVLEEDGDILDDAQTPAFDPYDPSNTACGSGTSSSSGEVAA